MDKRVAQIPAVLDEDYRLWVEKLSYFVGSVVFCVLAAAFVINNFLPEFNTLWFAAAIAVWALMLKGATVDLADSSRKDHLTLWYHIAYFVYSAGMLLWVVLTVLT